MPKYIYVHGELRDACLPMPCDFESKIALMD